MIYFRVPKPQSPSGGVWFLYRCVQLLNRAGVPARAIQSRQENYAWWDANPIEMEYIVTRAPTRDIEVLVTPEVMWPADNPKEARHIMFCQNYQWWPDKSSPVDKEMEVLVCSRHLVNEVRRRYGIQAIGKVTPFLDDGVWEPTPKQANRTLVMARRNNHHVALRAALKAEGFPVEYVDVALSQRELAERLSRCEYYVHLVYPEGFPMACLEAMRMGTIVVGTTGGGGLEFMFHRETACVVQDPVAGRYSESDFINGIMEQLRWLRSDAEARSRIWQAAYEWSKRYTAAETTKELLEVFGKYSVFPNSDSLSA